MDVALSGASAFALASTFAVAGSNARPGRKVTLRREDSHLQIHLGDHHRGQATVDAWNLTEQLDLLLVRFEPLLNLAVEPGDVGIQLVDSPQLDVEHLSMVVAKLSVEGQLKLRNLLSQFSFGEPAQLTQLGTIEDLLKVRRVPHGMMAVEWRVPSPQSGLAETTLMQRLGETIRRDMQIPQTLVPPPWQNGNQTFTQPDARWRKASHFVTRVIQQCLFWRSPSNRQPEDLRQ